MLLALGELHQPTAQNVFHLLRARVVAAEHEMVANKLNQVRRQVVAVFHEKFRVGLVQLQRLVLVAQPQIQRRLQQHGHGTVLVDG